MHTTIAHAVFDESGDTGRSERSTRHFVVIGIVCDNLEILNRAISRTRKDIPHKKRGNFPELKAHLAHDHGVKKTACPYESLSPPSKTDCSLFHRPYLVGLTSAVSHSIAELIETLKRLQIQITELTLYERA